MLKPLLFGTAMIFALPALAQTTSTTGGTSMSQTGTTTNDHDPTMTNDTAQPAGTTMGSQVNGGTMDSSTGMRTTTTTTTTGSDWGTGSAAGTASGTTGSTGAYTGQGGPDTGMKSYPPCTRTRTDSCTQMGGRHRR